MRYSVIKLRHKIIHVPDSELAELLRIKPKSLQLSIRAVSSISAFKNRDCFRALLCRHSRAKGRFFICADLVHAFHQIERWHIARYFPQVADKGFDVCFVQLAGKWVLPIGAATSNYFFEIFATRHWDPGLIAWQQDHSGVVTRYCDNLVATWRNNRKDVFASLQKTFCGFQVRFTPKLPRRWIEPIRFCGKAVPVKGLPRISREKRSQLIKQARQKSSKAMEGVLRFAEKWGR